MLCANELVAGAALTHLFTVENFTIDNASAILDGFRIGFNC